MSASNILGRALFYLAQEYLARGIAMEQQATTYRVETFNAILDCLTDVKNLLEESKAILENKISSDIEAIASLRVIAVSLESESNNQ